MPIPSRNEYIPPRNDGYVPSDASSYQRSYEEGYREGMAASGGNRGIPENEERTWAIIAHLAGPVAMILSVGWAGFVGPLAIWLFFRRRSSFVRMAAARSFNFNVVLWIAIVIARVFHFLIITIPLAWVIWAFVGVVGLIAHLYAAWRASRHRLAHYPFSLPILQ